MHVLALKHDLYNFDGATEELNSLIFHLKQALHSINMSGKVYAKVENLKFCSLNFLFKFN